MKNVFSPQPWENDVGQVISPGEEIVAVTLSYKTISSKKGKFAGVYIHPKTGKVQSPSVITHNEVWVANSGYENRMVRKSIPSGRVYRIA